MAAGIDKVIVTNSSALSAKYDPSGVKAIVTAVEALIAADKARGLTTKLIRLDNTNDMKRIGGTPVQDATNPKQNKIAIDDIFTVIQPDYLLILGSVDVVPHQNLKNPAYNPGNDDDEFAPGDLPYACDKPYSQKIADFTSPTRVVGRLPDITGGRDPEYLVGLLGTAAGYTPSSFTAYGPYFGVSAGVWEKSSELSLQAIFGSATDLKDVPPDQPPWRSLLKRRSHFINCHGAAADPKFYGQPADGAQDYPIALDAADVDGKLAEGTVLAAECCFGAELYDPSIVGGALGMCNTYLKNQAYGYFGSSTIAYGPGSQNAWADLLCQYFWKHVLAGASLGRSVLQARQDYVQGHAVLSPLDLKTLAQFSLMADPALTPVQIAADHVVSKGQIADPGAGRSLRRSRLRQVGLALGETVPAAAVAKGAPAKGLREKLRAALPELAGAAPSAPYFQSFEIDIPKGQGYTGGRAGRPRRSRTAAGAAPRMPADQVVAVHLAMARRPSPLKTPQLSVVVGIEQDGQLILRTGFSR